MPIFRIVYIDDDTFTARTLSAEFTDRKAAEIEMARHGHRVVHMDEQDSRESARDPVVIPIARSCESGVDRLIAPRRAHPRATDHVLGVQSHNLAGAAVVVMGLAMAGAAIFLF